MHSSDRAQNGANTAIATRQRVPTTRAPNGKFPEGCVIPSSKLQEDLLKLGITFTPFRSEDLSKLGFTFEWLTEVKLVECADHLPQITLVRQIVNHK